MSKAQKKLTPVEMAAPAEPIRLDLGSGRNRKEGFLGVDQYPMEGVDLVTDLRETWPWDDNSVAEANCSHFLEHLTNLEGRWERVHFFNELYRVLKPGAQCLLTIPHWSSNRYFGDPTHKECFSEMGFYYLSREWRLSQAPHTDISFNPNGYDCDLVCTWGYSMHPSLTVRNQEYQQHAMQFWKEACQDMVATLKKPE